MVVAGAQASRPAAAVTLYFFERIVRPTIQRFARAGRRQEGISFLLMDMKTPDNAALHDPAFKRIVAYAIRDGLHAWAGLPVPTDD